jgi:glycerophosphoryl diester phosphodiesterase
MKKLIVIAHRGGAGIAPENTLASIKNAITLNVDYVEIDIQLTKDSIPVVIHDATVNRTTNGIGKVRNYTFNELSLLDAGVKFSKKFKGERIPSFSEIIKITKDKMPLIVEIKDVEAKYKIVEEIKKNKLENQITIVSFYTSIVKSIKEKFNEIQVGNLVSVKYCSKKIYEKIVDETLNFSGKFILVNYSAYSKTLLELAHRKNISVFIWTVNDVKLMKKFINEEVDGIATDYPNLLKKILI